MLTKTEIEKIKQLRESGLTLKEISNIFKCSIGKIFNAIGVSEAKEYNIKEVKRIITENKKLKLKLENIKKTIGE